MEIAVDVDITAVPLTNATKNHRNEVMQFFAPHAMSKPKRSTQLQIISARLFNGDWRRKDRFEHCCLSRECCQDRAQAIQKIRKFMPKFLKALSLRYLDADNWAEWDCALHLPGMLSQLHNLLQRALTRLFATGFRPVNVDISPVPGRALQE